MKPMVLMLVIFVSFYKLNGIFLFQNHVMKLNYNFKTVLIIHTPDLNNISRCDRYISI